MQLSRPPSRHRCQNQGGPVGVKGRTSRAKSRGEGDERLKCWWPHPAQRRGVDPPARGRSVGGSRLHIYLGWRRGKAERLRGVVGRGLRRDDQAQGRFAQRHPRPRDRSHCRGLPSILAHRRCEAARSPVDLRKLSVAGHVLCDPVPRIEKACAAPSVGRAHVPPPAQGGLPMLCSRKGRCSACAGQAGTVLRETTSPLLRSAPL
jgi:hypothetical protein